MSNFEKNIDIVMATYNGEALVAEQLDSLLAQTEQRFRIIIGDDGSQDHTLGVLASYKERYPETIIVFPFPDNVGPRDNFARLMDFVDSPYVMFCDQDDFWLPNKVEVTYRKMKELEAQWGTDIPLLVHTDLQVVDKELNVIHPSWRRFAGLTSKSFHLNRLLVRHAMIGCTMMVNKELLDIAMPIPTESGMHDYWASLVATAFGKVGSVEEATILYRQHGKNAIGARLYDYHWLKNEVLKNPEFQEEYTTRLMRTLVRAYMFHKRYSELMDPKMAEMVAAYALLKNQTFFRELLTRMKYGFFDQNIWLNLALLKGSYGMGTLSGGYSFKL